MRVSGAILVSLGLLGLSSCTEYALAPLEPAPLDPTHAPPEKTAQICVFRKGWYGHIWTGAVRDNGELVGATQGTCSYFCWQAGPGRHHIESEIAFPDVPIATADVTLAAGDTRLFQQRMVSGWELVAKDRASAKRVVEECDFQTLVAVPGDDDPPVDVPFVRGR